MELAKATLRKVSDKAVNPPQDTGSKDLIPVQINPATLRLQATASVDAGKEAGRARTQYQGTASTLTFDLVFDTSDQGSTESPRDVRTFTSQVEQFVWPAGPKAVPPRVEFRYGPLIVVGTMTSFNMDLDLFSANGVPLRAKCAVTIKEQKPAFDLVKEGAGAKDAPGATPPLQPSTAAAPGGPAGSAPATDRTGTALGGETASSFANRMGVDPRAWKGLQGVTDPLNLQAGQQINFASTLTVDAGLGVQIGASSVGSLTVGELGTAGAAGVAGTTDDLSASATAAAPVGLDGRELTSVGGLSRALSQAAGARAGAAAAAASNAFATSVASDSPPGATPTGGSSVAASLSSASGASTPTARVPGSTIPPRSDQLDPRAVGYGFGVPLRPRIGIVGPTTLGLVHERGRGVSSGGDQPPQSRDSSMPSWLALPASMPGSDASNGTSKGYCGTSGCTCDTLTMSGCRRCS